MSRPTNERLGEIEARLHHDDPRFSRALAAGRPREPREYRRRPAWLLLAAALAVLGIGLVLPQGLLIATGLVLAGVAGELLAPALDVPGRRASSLRPGPGSRAPARTGEGRDTKADTGTDPGADRRTTGG